MRGEDDISHKRTCSRCFDETRMIAWLCLTHRPAPQSSRSLGGELARDQDRLELRQNPRIGQVWTEQNEMLDGMQRECYIS